MIPIFQDKPRHISAHCISNALSTPVVLAGVFESGLPGSLLDAEVLDLLEVLRVHTLGNAKDAFCKLLQVLHNSPILQADLESTDGWKQLLQLAAQLVESPELLQEVVACLPDPGLSSDLLATVLPFVLLMGMSEARARQGVDASKLAAQHQSRTESVLRTVPKS